MSSMQVAQHLRRGCKRSGVRDAVEICGDVEHGSCRAVLGRTAVGGCPHAIVDYTGSSSCIQPASGFGSEVRSITNFSSTIRLLGGLERNARSVLATSRMARVSSRFDL